jgi:hypothetical protein
MKLSERELLALAEHNLKELIAEKAIVWGSAEYFVARIRKALIEYEKTLKNEVQR